MIVWVTCILFRISFRTLVWKTTCMCWTLQVYGNLWVGCCCHGYTYKQFHVYIQFRYCFFLHSAVWCWWKPLFVFTGRDVTHVEVEIVPCTKVSVGIFDPIFSSGIVYPSGGIAKCFHEAHPDFDELRMVSLHYLNQFQIALWSLNSLSNALCTYWWVLDAAWRGLW